MRYIPVLLGLCHAWAQVTTGGISGIVFDPSGRPIGGAEIKVTEERQTVARSAVADSEGYYRLLELSPAVYTVTCRHGRFEAVTATVTLAADTQLRVDFHLPLAGLKQSVEVRAQVWPIPTESSELGAVLDTDRIRSLPLNRRDFLQLALLTPGVAPPVQDSELSTRGNFAMHANGGREEFNNFLLDGVDNNDQDTNRYVLQPSVDAIQEFKIATNSYSAEYGRNAGGQVNVITRSGTAQWHGFGYEYLRNRVLDARNFFDGADKPKYIRNQFGAGGGGPLLRDRTFFFASFDGLRERQGMSRLASVPTAAQRRGDLSALGTPIMDPFTGAPFPGAVIPASRISSQASHLLALYPQPSLPGLAGNLLAQPVGRETTSQFNLRVDHRLTAHDDITARYSFGDKDLFEPYTEDPTGVPGFGDFLKDRGQNALIHHVHVWGASATNSILLGFNRGVRRLVPENFQTDVNKLWGVNYLPSQPLDFGYPSINVVGFSRVGDVTSLPIDRAANTYQIGEGFAIVRGRHALKTGVEMRKLQHNGAVRVLSRGSMSFFGDFTGAGVGDLLLGYPELGLQAQADNPQTMRTTAVNAYVQDDWRVRPNLTLNLGLRYEYNTPPTDPTNRMSILDLATREVVNVGTHGLSRSGLRPDWNNFAPRVGFAWTPMAHTVIRGGYGVYYDSGMFVVNSSLYFNPPYFNMYVYVPSPDGLLTLSDPFPHGGGFTPAPSLNTLSPNIVTSYLQSWNLNVQREFGAGIVSLAYAGSKGTHLIRTRDMNQPRPAPGDVADRVPNPNYGNIGFTDSGGNSSYQSLQATYQHGLGSRVNAWILYTLSKSIDDTSAFLATAADPNFPQDSLNFQAERARSSFDMHQRLAAALVWRLPGHSRLTRDFEFDTIVVAQSGQPFTPILRADNSNTGNTGAPYGSDRPNLIGSAALANRSPEEWFNTGAFTIPPEYTFGTAGRNILLGPAYFSTDVSLSRAFRLSEHALLKLEAQGFNLFNRVNFNLPERIADDPANFGRIYSAKAPRQLQFAVRLGF